MWRDNRERPSLLPQLRSQALKVVVPPRLGGESSSSKWLGAWLWPSLLCLLCFFIGWLGPAPKALAAEILSVRQPTLLQIGDQNRNYLVQLACLDVPSDQSPQALAWLQEHGPRGTRVNIRPLSQNEGILLAKVSVLKTGLDLGDALLAHGLATPSPCPQDDGEA